MILAIDFDQVIHNKAVPVPGRRMGEPLFGAKEAMQQLSGDDHELIVHTVMATNMSGKKAVEDWLTYYGVPFDEVTAVKPNADIFLDDKAIRFINWEQALKEIDVHSDQSDS